MSEQPKQQKPSQPAQQQQQQEKQKPAAGKASAVDPDGHLKSELQTVQAASKQAPEPEAVKLIIPPKDPMGQPSSEVPKAPVAPAAPAPRFVHPNHRAPHGLRRFRVRVDNMGNQPARYVLAPDEEAARACYLEGLALDRVLAAMGEEAPEPRLAVKEMPD